MKKFKHKTKNLTAQQVGTDRYEVNENHESLPRWAIEDSCDWEEVSYKVEDYYGDGYSKKKVLSLTRMKDNKTFKVGDIVQSYNGWVKGEIEEFLENGYGILVRLKDPRRYVEFEGIEHTKKFLFTTEDSVDIFEGDSYYRVDISGVFGFWEVMGYFKAAGDGVYNDKDAKYFSTREAAEEYIINNKPCLSFVEVSHALRGLSYFQAKNLLDIVKEKL